MRRFSEEEKETIRRMLWSYNNNPQQYILINAYNDIFYARKVSFDVNEGPFLILYRQKEDPNIIKDVFDVENHILTISLLIKYLTDEGLIYLLDTCSINTLEGIKGFNERDNEIPVRKQIDSTIFEILKNSLSKRIYIGETLKVLVADNFMTTEDKLYSQVLQLSSDTTTLNKNTLDLVRESNSQTSVTTSLYSESIEQTKQAKEQVAAAQALATAASRQATEAENQTVEARIQSKESKKQTKNSYLALGLSLLAIAVSIAVAKFITMDVKVIDKQYEEVIQKLDSLSSKSSQKNTVPADSVFIKNNTLDVRIHSAKKK